MSHQELDSLRYPLGKFKAPEDYQTEDFRKWISSIRSLPDELEKLVAHLSDEQLDTPYREGGWTIRQVVHHLADSHLNGYSRMKLALTEEEPTIKLYNQKLWAETWDGKKEPIESSIDLLKGLHARWVTFLESLSVEDFSKVFIHPENLNRMSVGLWTSIYAWHGKHHMAHIRNLIESKSW